MNADESDWVVAVCSVVFDLDVGQQLEHVYPNEALSEPTASAVAFHAFPVSNECRSVPVSLKRFLANRCCDHSPAIFEEMAAKFCILGRNA